MAKGVKVSGGFLNGKVKSFPIALLLENKKNMYQENLKMVAHISALSSDFALIMELAGIISNSDIKEKLNKFSQSEKEQLLNNLILQMSYRSVCNDFDDYFCFSEIRLLLRYFKLVDENVLHAAINEAQKNMPDYLKLLNPSRGRKKPPALKQLIRQDARNFARTYTPPESKTKDYETEEEQHAGLMQKMMSYSNVV